MRPKRATAFQFFGSANQNRKMILEGIVTTLNRDGSPNIAPMGPLTDPDISELRFRPFKTSTTYANLRRTGCGIFHVVDDVELLARAAIGRFDAPPHTSTCEAIDGAILADACRWYAFRIVESDDANERAEMTGEIIACGRLKEFFGFNRAKHAVVEAAILATRIGIIPDSEIRSEFDRLEAPVAKTAGDSERRAFDLLSRYFDERLRNQSAPMQPAAS